MLYQNPPYTPRWCRLLRSPSLQAPNRKSHLYKHMHPVHLPLHASRLCYPATLANLCDKCSVGRSKPVLLNANHGKPLGAHLRPWSMHSIGSTTVLFVYNCMRMYSYARLVARSCAPCMPVLNTLPCLRVTNLLQCSTSLLPRSVQ